MFVGLDYHSKSVQVCVVDGEGKELVNRKCGNSVAEIGVAVGPGRVIRRAAVESCCGAADLADGLIADLKWPLSLAHPGYVQRMKHNPDKTDYSDARMLAELCRAGFIPPVWLAPRSVRELRLLVRLRADLVGQLRATKVRILAVLWPCTTTRCAGKRERGRPKRQPRHPSGPRAGVAGAGDAPASEDSDRTRPGGAGYPRRHPAHPPRNAKRKRPP